MKYQTKTQEFNLKEWRKRMGLSTRKFAKIIGSDYSYLYKLEQGKYVASYEFAKRMFGKMEQWKAQNNKNQNDFFPDLNK